MISRSRPPRRPDLRAAPLCFCLLLAGPGFLPACGKSEPAASAPAKPDQVYSVRAKIDELPQPGRPQSEFRLHHEAIDQFVDGSGKVVGMSSMVMGFALDKSVSAEGLKPGDFVQLEFAVWWKGQPPLRYPDYKVTKLTKLPADTKLEFRAAVPVPANQADPKQMGGQ